MTRNLLELNMLIALILLVAGGLTNSEYIHQTTTEVYVCANSSYCG